MYRRGGKRILWNSHSYWEKRSYKNSRLLLVATEAAGVTGTNCIRWNFGGRFPCRKTALPHSD